MIRAMLVLSFALFAVTSAAQADELSAEEIVKRSLEGGAVGFEKGVATLEMKIKKASGEQKSHVLEVKAMKDDAGLFRSLIRIKSPAELAGMTFLVREKKDQLPDQYVYMPAVKVVQRVTAGKAGSAFFGSDLTYGDLMPLPKSQLKSLTLTRLADGEISKQPTHVISVLTNVAAAPYSKLVIHVHQKYLVPLKVEFYDQAGKLLKVMTTRKLKKINGKHVPVSIKVKNVQRGSSTTIRILKLSPDAPLSENDFTEEAMKR